MMKETDYCNHVFENHNHLSSSENENCSSDWREHLKHVEDLLLKPEVVNTRKKRESFQVPRCDNQSSDFRGTRANNFEYNKKTRHQNNFTPSEIKFVGRHQKRHVMEMSSQPDAKACGKTLDVASGKAEILQDFYGQPQLSNKENGRARHRGKEKKIRNEEKEIGREASQDLSGHPEVNYRYQKTVVTGTRGGFVHVSGSDGEFRGTKKHSSPTPDDQTQKTTCSEPTSKDPQKTKSKKPRRKHKKVSIDGKETEQGMSQTLSGPDEDFKRPTVKTGGREGFVPIPDSGREFRSTDSFHSTDDQSPSPESAIPKSTTKNSEKTDRKNSSKRKIENLKRSKFYQEKISGDRTKLLQENESLRVDIPLYVKIHALFDGIGKVEEVLNKKLKPEGVSVRPDETNVKKFNSCTYCTIYCLNKYLAKKLEEFLLKDKDKFTPAIDCSFVEYEETSCRQRRLETGKTERNFLIAQTRCELNAKADAVLAKHDQNMTAMKESLNSAKKKLSKDVNCKQKESEVAVLEERIVEMERQKAEFMNSRTAFAKNLESLLEGDTFEKERRDLLKQYGVECCRLEKPLPMYARRRDIVDLVANNQVSVILGETGSGKSTQMVQYLMEAGFAKTGFIASTQPRKIAAISLAIRVAEELASQTGKVVGYKVGSKSRHCSDTKIIFMTDLTLLNECLKDPEFSQYSCILVDEAHERSLYTDLLLTMIKRCLPRRPDLRVVITSATIDPEVFVAFFGNCPVLTVSGRTYPVEVIWQDDVVEEYAFDNYVEEAAKKAVDIHLGKEPGDILVFLTSMVETEKCCRFFQQKMGQRNDYKCFQLHGKLPPDEQRVVFQPLGKDQRKIIFATNFAETSITIDGIRFVVDTGVAKEMSFDPKKNMNCLVVSPVSKSSAEQRKGRAGRTAPGKCYRLYSKRSFRAMKPASLPEILRTHVGQAILKLADFGIGPDMYDFVESPSEDAITQAQTSLVRLGALAKDGTITEEGKWIARLPFDPKLGLLTSLGKKSNLLFDSVVLSAVMNADGNVFYRGTTAEKQAKHDKAKVKFSESGGDCLTALSVLKKWWSIPKNQKSKWCMDNSLNSKVLNGVSETVAEILHTLKKEVNIEVRQTFSNSENAEDLLRRMLFKCYSSNLCHYLGLERAGYFAAELSRQVHVHPSSCMNVLAMSPEWVVYNQVLKTSRDFITGLTVVEESWLYDDDNSLGFEVEEIRKKKVTNIFTQAAGSHVFFSLIGPHYCKLAEYEEMASSEASTVVVVEASREKGEVKVYSTGGDVCTLVNRLKETAEKSAQELVDEDMELTVGKETSGLRVILGRGGEVKDLMMPEESRKVFISKPSDTTSEDSLRAKFSEVGEIKFCKKFDRGKNWGLLIFRTREEAKMAEEMSKNDKYDVARVEWRPAVKYQANLKARLKWCRRPLSGTGCISVSPAYLADVCRLKSFYVENDLVKIRLDKKKDDSFYISDLKPSATKELVEGCLLHALGLPPDKKGIVEDTFLHRRNVEKTSERERNRLRTEIKNAFQDHLKFSDVEVKVKPPNDKD
ncbi:hypothetical protein C0Q70_07102 [Pomacea canaliculata]|uniref:RNA helicase n=2 Tax=Pomacea canaliculata TaxID=400727 RepID=A0A2T7PE41_POMCA|nr:hypothetical protein C0Q70_07102 [Pomacea canaliculata]